MFGFPDKIIPRSKSLVATEHENLYKIKRWI